MDPSLPWKAPLIEWLEHRYVVPFVLSVSKFVLVESDTIPPFPGGDKKQWKDWRTHQFKFLFLVFQRICNNPLLLNSFVWFYFLPFLVVLNNIHSIHYRKINCCIIIIFGFLFFFFSSRAIAAEEVELVFGQWNPPPLYHHHHHHPFLLLLPLPLYLYHRYYCCYPGWWRQ